jgi:hypothetical protein
MALSEYPLWTRHLLGPGSILAEERIGEDDEFSHDGFRVRTH